MAILPISEEDLQLICFKDNQALYVNTQIDFVDYFWFMEIKTAICFEENKYSRWWENILSLVQEKSQVGSLLGHYLFNLNYFNI